MIKISENVYFIEGRDDMIPDSHVYIIGNPESNDLSMVDAGLMGRAGYKIKDIEDMGLNLEDIKRIIMTHTHLDHIGCLSEMQGKMPWLELWVHDLEAESLEQGDERTVYGMDMFKNMCQMQYGLRDGIFKFRVDRRLYDGDWLEIGGVKWEVLHIPGHSVGCIALYDESRGILIPGDVVYADYAIGRFDLHNADPEKHGKSLSRLSQLKVNILLPGHNRIMQEVPEGYIRDTAEKWRSYLQ